MGQNREEQKVLNRWMSDLSGCEMRPASGFGHLQSFSLSVIRHHSLNRAIHSLG